MFRPNALTNASIFTLSSLVNLKSKISLFSFKCLVLVDLNNATIISYKFISHQYFFQRMVLFEVIDKSGRRVRLTEKQWMHIIEHPEMADKIDYIRDAVQNPDKLLQSPRDESVVYYFKYHKNIGEYLLVAVKYLNGDGFIITSFYTTKLTI